MIYMRLWRMTHLWTVWLQWRMKWCIRSFDRILIGTYIFHIDLLDIFIILLLLYSLFWADVQDSWAGNNIHVLLSRVGAYKLFNWEIQQLGPNMELGSEVCFNCFVNQL